MRAIQMAMVCLAVIATAEQMQGAPITVKEYNTVNWSTGTNNENTIAQFSSMAFGGQVANSADLIGTDIVIAGAWNSFFHHGLLTAASLSGTIGETALPNCRGSRESKQLHLHPVI